MKTKDRHYGDSDAESPSLRTLIENDPDLHAAFDAICSTNPSYRFIFISGPAGTGKSTFIRALLAEMNQRHLLMAPTGVAALNIDGRTIHSALSIDPAISVYLPNLAQHDNPIGYLRKLERVVIDEISMVRADLLDMIDSRLRDAMPSIRKDNPFGGVQVVAFGDLFQLPPVVNNANKAFFRSGGEWRTPFFFSAHTLDRLPIKVIQLTHVYRQHDEEAQRILAAIRHGTVDQETVERLNAICHRLHPPENIPRLVSTRRSAEQINISRLNAITEVEYTYNAIYEGHFIKPQKGDDRLPAPDPLKLKKSALVMFTKNDPGKRWVNGTVGVVKSLSQNSIHVYVADANETYEIFRETWEKAELKLNPTTNRHEKHILGRYIQFPLMLAWAITIHKSQGKTLSRVAVDYERGGAFAPGQTYVALSRTRSLTDIYLTRPITLADIRADENVVRFFKSINGDTPPRSYGDLLFRRRGA